jgi:hypothetical protein
MTREAQTTGGEAEKTGTRLIKIGVIYLLVGLSLGIGMGVSHDFRLSSVHAHILLIGWATMVISGVVYIVQPNCGNSWLAKVHYWLLNVGLPGMVVGLALLSFGKETGERIVAPGSFVVLLSVAAFALNVFLNIGSGMPGSKQRPSS